MSQASAILGDPGADRGAEDENQNGREKIRQAKVRKKNTSPKNFSAQSERVCPQGLVFFFRTFARRIFSRPF